MATNSACKAQEQRAHFSRTDKNLIYPFFNHEAFLILCAQTTTETLECLCFYWNGIFLLYIYLFSNTKMLIKLTTVKESRSFILTLYAFHLLLSLFILLLIRKMLYLAKLNSSENSITWNLDIYYLNFTTFKSGKKITV